MVSSWIKWWKKRKWLYAFVIVSALIALGYSALRIEVINDARSTLPEHEAFDELKALIDSVAKSTTLFIAVDDSESNAESVWARVDSIAGRFGTSNDEELKNLMVVDLNSIYHRIPLLLTPEDYVRVDSLIHSRPAHEVLRDAVDRLSAPGAFIGAQTVTLDPYGIGALVFDRLQAAEPLAPIVENGDRLELRTGQEVRTYLLHADLKSADKVELLTRLNDLKLQAKAEGIPLSYFSTVLIEAENVRQIEDDLGITLIIAVVAILLLLVVVYRQLLVPLFFLVPGGIALILALGLVALIKGQIAGIAIGAGSVVLGIVLDYAFHFYTHLQHTQNVLKTAKEVSTPLLASCLTTVLAFGMLIFTSSPILADFGIFASLALLSAVFTMLFIVPVFVSDHTMKPLKWGKLPFGKWGKWLRPASVLVIVVVSIFMVGKLDEAQFDADLDNLNHYPQELRDAEELFSGIKAEKEKRLFLKYSDQQATTHFQVGMACAKLKSEGLVSGYLLQDYTQPSVQYSEAAFAEWQNHLMPKADSLITELNKAGEELGFQEGAFEPFYQFMVAPQPPEIMPGGMAMSFLVAPKEHLEAVKSELGEISGLEIIDMRANAYSLVKAVEDDFNFILIASSLLVFVILLLMYGRLELALVTFLPMALSWIWIVGATVLLDIKFNFVNVILSTFIFGLGDDFAIFITDGYMSKHKYGRDTLSSYTSAIVLSALTTLIGMAALLFAGHPAIQSISTLSVLGIVIIVFISLTLQPALFKFLIIRRDENGLPPLTLWGFFWSLMAFAEFAIGSAIGVIFSFILRPLPIPKSRKKRMLRKVLQLGCLFVIYASLNVKKRRVALKNLDMSRPSVIVTNHQSFIDILAMISLSPDLVIMTKKWVYKNPLFGPAVRYAGYLYTEDPPEVTQQKIKDCMDEGCSVMIFPEGTRTLEAEHKRWHKGAFFIADQYKLDISPVILHGYGYAMPKNDYLLSDTTMSTIALERIAWNDDRFGTGHRERTKQVSAHVREAYEAYDREYGQTSYHFHRILGAFLYKGPIVEWYFRVKWRLERENFEKYDRMIPESGKIYDLGCGYGYLSLYLACRQMGRTIVGVDYDEEKIELAANHYLNGERIHFESADLREYKVSDASAIFLNDVLHYMNPSEQIQVLRSCVDGLTENGVLIIRDGLKNLEAQHGMTRLTEYFSTQLFKFNKTTNELHFFDREFIDNFARENGLTLEYTPPAGRTSNALFVLRRK
ncbi:MAG: MMPL family transporter [Flavobacteriales bacterium]|nr:MMPL family transporter [Flavobacteriales bacterium]